MSEQPEREPTSRADGGKNVAARKETTAGKPARPKGSGSGFFRLLLLLVLLGGLGAGGWFGWQWLLEVEQQYTQQWASQQDAIRELQNELQLLRETTVDVGSFSETQDAIASSQDALQDRMNALAASIDDLRDTAQGGRRDLLHAEIEYLLRIAADELYLTGDVDAAIYALQAADDRLRALEAPRLLPVREAIADHLAALSAVAVPDTNGMALKLGSLMRAVKTLPLAQSEYAREQEDPRETAAEDGWWQRFKAGTSRLFSKLVTVNKAEPPPPLLSPQEHFFLYRNVELQFAAARAALLQGDTLAYRQSLETAREWLNRYFDTDDAQVQGMLSDINGLLAVSLQPDLPDISGALMIFRRLADDDLAIGAIAGERMSRR